MVESVVLLIRVVYSNRTVIIFDIVKQMEISIPKLILVFKTNYKIKEYDYFRSAIFSAAVLFLLSA